MWVFRCLAAVLLLAGPAATASRWRSFEATAYSIEGETASGKQTREGRTVASDPDLIPLGAKIQVRGAGPYDGVYVVHDSGRTIKGREIDIFIDNNAEAKKFGRKKVRVRVLELPKPTPSQ